jgi:hypothetical protein
MTDETTKEAVIRPVCFDDPPETTNIPCGCGEYELYAPSHSFPDAISVQCPKCGNWFGYGDSP